VRGSHLAGPVRASQSPTGATITAGYALPAGAGFTAAGRGSWHTLHGTTGQTGSDVAREFTYAVEVEDGLDPADVGGEQAFAQLTDRTLADPRGWTAGRRVAFRRIDAGTPDFRIALTSQQTTRRVCGVAPPIDTSCFDQNSGRVVLHEARWVRGALPFGGDLGSYRQYMVNHEVGSVIEYRHAIEYHQPVACQTDGGPAPVMMPQTLGTADDDIARFAPTGAVPRDGKVCRYNPWPYPRA
jgi:Protein of unknown function (DUF3152)